MRALSRRSAGVLGGPGGIVQLAGARTRWVLRDAAAQIRSNDVRAHPADRTARHACAHLLCGYFCAQAVRERRLVCAVLRFRQGTRGAATKLLDRASRSLRVPHAVSLVPVPCPQDISKTPSAEA